MANPSHSFTTVSDALLAAVGPDAPDAALPAAPDLDTESDFQRPELGKEKLAGTVQFHKRHKFLCYKGPEVWPSHVKVVEFDYLPRLLAAAIRARKPNLKKSTKLTICDGEVGTESSNGDVLIFPVMIRYRGLTHFVVDNFFVEVLVKDIEWLPRSPEAIQEGSVKQVSFYDDDVRFWQHLYNCSATAEAPTAVNQQSSAVSAPAPSTRGWHFVVICCENKVIFLESGLTVREYELLRRDFRDTGCFGFRYPGAH